MRLNTTIHPEATDFNDLLHAEKQAIVVAALRACSEAWGEVCMPAADIGDNRQFVMEQLCDWVDQLTDCHCSLCASPSSR